MAVVMSGAAPECSVNARDTLARIMSCRTATPFLLAVAAFSRLKFHSRSRWEGSCAAGSLDDNRNSGHSARFLLTNFQSTYTLST